MTRLSSFTGAAWRPLLCLLTLLAGPVAADERIDDYAWQAPITLRAEAPFHRIELDAGIYRSLTRNDLGDLRVFNGAGEIVPHALEPRQQAHSNPPQAVDVPLFVLGTAADSGRALNLRVETGPDGAVISLGANVGPARGPAGAWLVDASQVRQRLQALELRLADPTQQLSGRMRVEASNDLAQWRTLSAGAPLLQLHTDEHRLGLLRIEWPATPARYLRLTWSGAPPPDLREHVFAAVRVEPVPLAIETPRTWLALPPPTVRETGGRVEYHFTLPGAVPADRLRIALPQPNSVVPVEVFSRPRPDAQWRSLGRHSIYRLTQDDTENRNPDLQLALAGELMLRVDARGGGLGSGLPSAEVGWLPHHLVFAARGEPPFTLAWGRARAEAGAYPIGSLLPDYGKDEGGRLAVADAQLGSVLTAGGEARLAAPVDARRWMLWIALLSAVALLGFMAWKLSRQIGGQDTERDSGDSAREGE